MRKKIRLAQVVGVLGLAMCTVVFVGDLQVRWSIDGVESPSKCTEYGVANWKIVLYELPGRVKVDEITAACGTWDTGNLYYNTDEGEYAVDVVALDGAGNELAAKSKEFLLVDDGETIWTVTLDFTAADFRGIVGPECGDGACDAGESYESCPEDCQPAADSSLFISWKINGTVDGTATGKSFDTCEEVGATQVAITIDGQTTAFGCADDDQSVQIMGLVAGEHDVSVVLQDDDGDITTTASDTLVAARTPAEEAFEFYFDSFLEPRKSEITGDYLFLTLFEAGLLTCSETNPQVGQQVVLLQLDGTPVPGQTCRLDGSSCLNLNNNDFGICFVETQAIADLPWGSYKLAVQGVPVGSTSVCWETVHETDGTKLVDILVGAGTDNPVDDIVLERIDDTGDCTPL